MSNSNQSNNNSVFTFGYGNRKGYETLIDYLKEYKITCLIDVRLNPRAWSRKWYGDNIQKMCESQNVEYISEKSLGNTSGNSNWIPPEPEKAEKALQELSEMLEKGNILLLCAEMDNSRCHRTEVANQLQILTKSMVKHLK
jgi:uncharacterized protein (DUF488 family)